MSYNVSVRQVGAVSIVDVSGRLVLDDVASIQRDTIKGLLQAGARNILVNLKDAAHIDSGALGELMSAYVSVANAGGQIKLLNVQGR